VLLFCAGIFWSVTCAAMAVGSNLKNPLKHLLTGAVLQVVGFIIVGVICLAAQRKAGKFQTVYENEPAYQSNQVDEW
jgi:choline-glycine betaine transporter